MPAAARKVAFTDKSLKALKPGLAGKRATIWDALKPGLAVRVTDKGKRSFVVVRRCKSGKTGFAPSLTPLPRSRMSCRCGGGRRSRAVAPAVLPTEAKAAEA